MTMLIIILAFKHKVIRFIPIMTNANEKFIWLIPYQICIIGDPLIRKN